MKLAYLFVSYPGRSQAFLHREIAGLTRQGFTVEIHALWRRGPVTPGAVPVGATLHGFPWWGWWGALPSLLRILCTQPRLLARAWRTVRAHPPCFAENWWHSLLGLLFALARLEHFRKSGITHLHGAWATAPATAAAILSALLPAPFSFGAQAYDIYRGGGDAFLAPKMRAARFIHTTTQANVVYLTSACPEAAHKIKLIRRGLDHLPSPRAYETLNRPLRILSVARLIPKKGHRHQLEAAAALLAQGIPFQLKIVGDGPLRPELEQSMRKLGLQPLVEFCGHQEQAAVQDCYRWTDLFWHTGIIDPEGDRDGLPNVVPEAMAHGAVVVASSVGAVTEAIRDDWTGLVRNVGEPMAWAEAARRLAEDVELRRRLGEEGRRWVESNFLSSEKFAPDG